MKPNLPEPPPEWQPSRAIMVLEVEGHIARQTAQHAAELTAGRITAMRVEELAIVWAAILEKVRHG